MEILVNSDFLKYYSQDLIAKSGISTLYSSIYDSNSDQFKQLFDVKEIILNNNSENIMLRNAITYFMYKLKNKGVTSNITTKYDDILKEFVLMRQDIAKHGSKKIKPGSHVFVYGINKQVVDVLNRAAEYKKFEVLTLEHGPFLFSKHLKRKLSDKNIKLKIYHDMALDQALNRADICIIGGDLINKDRVVSKFGSSIIINQAREHNVHTYITALSYMFDSKTEMNHILDIKEKGVNVFDSVSSDNINGIISNLGIHKPKHFEHEVRFHHKWMFV